MLEEYNTTLKNGFWAMTRVVLSFEDEFTKTSDVCEEFNEDEHFVRHAQDCLVELLWIN